MNKKMGLLGSVSMLIGAMIGAAVFVLLGPLADVTGPSLPLAFLLGALPAFFGSAYYIQLGSMFPSSGGTYMYTSRLLSPMFGVMAAFWMIFAGVGAIGMLASGFVDYIGFYIDHLPIQTTALVTVVVFVIINLFGIRFSSLLQIYMVIWMVGALVIYILFGILGQENGSIVAVYNGPMLRNGMSGLLMATVLSFYSYAGYGLITEIGDEIENPQKNTPRAIMISLIFVTLIYMGAAYVSTTVIPLEQFIGFRASLPMAAAFFLPEWAVHVIAIGGLLAIFTSLNAMLLIFPHELSVMAKDRAVSPIFMSTHKKFKTPYISLLSIGLITIVLIRLGFTGTVFATMTVVGMLLGSVLLGCAALCIFKKAPKLYEAAPVKVPKVLFVISTVLGIVSSFIFTVVAVLDVPLVGVMALAIGIFSILYSCFYVKEGGRQKLNIDDRFNKMS